MFLLSRASFAGCPARILTQMTNTILPVIPSIGGGGLHGYCWPEKGRIPTTIPPHPYQTPTRIHTEARAGAAPTRPTTRPPQIGKCAPVRPPFPNLNFDSGIQKLKCLMISFSSNLVMFRANLESRTCQSVAAPSYVWERIC